MNKNFFAVILLIICIFSFLGLLVAQVQAIGQMTEPIVIKDVLRGQEIKETITLINSEKKSVIFQIKGDGQIADWVSFYSEGAPQAPVSEFEVAPSFYYDATAIFKVPTGTPNGVYEGNIIVLVVPDKEQSNQSASVGFSVSRPVTITVSDKEVVAADAAIIPVKYSVNSGESAQIRVVYDNKGNIAIKPNLQLKITQNGAPIFNAIFPYPENLEAVKPLEQKELPLIEWQTAGQKEGNYDAVVIASIGEKQFKTENITFTITAKGGAALPDVGKALSADMGFKWLILGVIVFATIVFFLFIAKSKNK